MIYFLFGVLALGALLFILDWVANAKPFKVARFISYLLGALFIALALFLVVTGRGAAVLPLLLAATVSFWRAPKRQNNKGQTGLSSGAHAMSEQEALDVLGLEKGASLEDIKTAHRNLIRKMHPDHGGTSYLAQRINEAKDVLTKLK